jgi:cyclomaltodextrinase / maltogenic alpha-amylase / neopullulanase
MTKEPSSLLIFLMIFLSSCSPNKNINRVPDWAKDAVWYQIFPERFNNGDQSNDPTPQDIIEGWPHEVPDGWQIHPWTSDWYKTQPWENNGHDFYWNAGLRRYGGDLQGVIDKLDYLQDLGINAIYFNPVFESPSLHKYDATYYHHVDNNFGPDPEKDKEIWDQEINSDPITWKWTTADSLFLSLIDKAHKRNIRVILDGVFNHVGNTFWAFKDIIKNQEKSSYKEWFTINSYDDPKTPENEFDYEGWYGIKDLPEIKEDENGLIDAAADQVHSVVKRWMDPNNDGDPSDGIDGWRLDVAEMVQHNFWRKFRGWVKEINPNAYISGEIWWDDWNINKMMNASPWLQGDQFDAVMNYRFTRAVKHFVSDQENQISSQSFIDTINNISKDYNFENLSVMMNLLGSHDTERLASLIVNPDNWYDHNGNPGQRKTFMVRKPNEIERMKQRLIVGIQMTMPGAPMIYYGDEAGMWGGDDPDCRKPMVWAEKDYETETTHPFGLERPKDDVGFNSTLFNWYKLMISIRNTNIELRRGALTFINSNEDDILIYRRELENNSIYVVTNRNNQPKEIELKDIDKNMTNLLTEDTISESDTKIKLKLNPYEIAILK